MSDLNVDDIRTAIHTIKYSLGRLEWDDALQEKIEDFEKKFEEERKKYYVSG
jgi:predicted PolB exonuclease-like 3'-5' exonuclease